MVFRRRKTWEDVVKVFENDAYFVILQLALVLSNNILEEKARRDIQSPELKID